jgi:GT2 family glycosyltransferase
MFSVKLSIIIVNYNGEKYLDACIKSIYKNCHTFSFEIIVFDNNSTDNSIFFIEQNYPDVIIIESDKNLGFAKGNNKAVKNSNGEYVLLLNNDTILNNNLQKAIEVFESDDKIGVLGIKMLDDNKKFSISFGKFPTPLKLLKFSRLNYKSKDFLTGKFLNENFVQVDWVSGAFLLTKKDYWNKVNGLDEDYFMYVEDVDFCKKISKTNKITVLVLSISFIHFIGFNSKREIRLIKGYFLYASKHFNKFEELIAKLCLHLNYAFKKAFKNIH